MGAQRLVSLRTGVIIAVLVVGVAFFVTIWARNLPDTRRSQDLATIAAAIPLSGSLPQSLKDVHITGLHNPLTEYSYKVISEDAPTPSYQLCTTFEKSAGLPYVPDSSSHVYFSVHRKGNQCYEVDLDLRHNYITATPLLGANEN